MKSILFTGATGGLGEACIRLLSEAGRFQVFASGTNEKKLAELKKYDHVIPLPMDITDEQSVLRACKTVSESTDSLYAIVNFAGRSAMTSMVEGDCVDTAKRLMEINVLGMIRVNRMFFDLILKGKGRIVNCSSEAGWMTAQPFAAPYFLSKRAVEAYSDSLRRELMFLGIPVIKIQPGSFQTGMTKSIQADFQNILSGTRYYRNVLSRLKPMMMQELSHDNDPNKLASVVLRALTAKHPKLRYRIGTGKLLLFLEYIPEKGVDMIYKTLLRLLPSKDEHLSV